MKLINHLKWRYATKKYDTSRKVSERDMETIKEAIQLSATSYGLQLYKVLLIENPSMRERLKPASWGQAQVTEASHLMVFCTYDDVTPERIDEFVKLKAEVQGVPVEKLRGYGDFIKAKMEAATLEEKQEWMARQVYIALGKALVACAELHIDSTPMEGFEPDQYDEILGLHAKGLASSVVLAIGYRSEEDANQHLPKVRKSMDTLFETI